MAKSESVDRFSFGMATILHFPLVAPPDLSVDSSDRLHGAIRIHVPGDGELLAQVRPRQNRFDQQGAGDRRRRAILVRILLRKGKLDPLARGDPRMAQLVEFLDFPKRGSRILPDILVELQGNPPLPHPAIEQRSIHAGGLAGETGVRELGHEQSMDGGLHPPLRRSSRALPRRIEGRFGREIRRFLLGLGLRKLRLAGHDEQSTHREHRNPMPSRQPSADRIVGASSLPSLPRGHHGPTLYGAFILCQWIRSLA